MVLKGLSLSLPLHSAGNLTRTQATGAGVNTLRGTVYDRLDTLDVGLPCTVGSSVGVADLDTKGNALITKFALCHSLKHLLACVSLNRQLLYNNRTAGQLQEQIM